MMRRINKNAVEFNFEWLFAIVAGATILILAVYGVSRLGNTQRYQTDTEIAKQLAIITDPLQAGFAEGVFSKIIFNQDTRINNICYSEDFGKNDMSVATKSGVGSEWQDSGGATSIHNKYIFSDAASTGRDYYVFSTPFYFPYKVSDLIFLSSDSNEYCFISPPRDVENMILGLNMPHIKVNNCSDNGNIIRVCFGTSGGDCEISVYGSCTNSCGELGVYNEGYVEKFDRSVKMNYVGNLIYGAILSDKGVYDCNVKRLLYRTGEIAEIFSVKAGLMDSRDCSTNLNTDLAILGEISKNDTVDDLFSLNPVIKQIEAKNEQEICGLW
ncbi:MAG: hypothetical protein WCP89_03750 [archaeon]